MIHINEFTKRVAPDVLGCPTKMIWDATLDSISRFCADTWVMQRGFETNIASVDAAINNEAAVELTEYIGDDQRPIGIQYLEVNGVAYPVAKLHVVTNVTSVRSEITKKFYYFEDNATLKLFPMSIGTIYLEIPITPLSSAAYFEPVLFDSWLDPIIAGAKYRLLRMPKKDWTNPAEAEMMNREYKRGVVMARRLVRKEYSNTPLDVTPRSDKLWF